MRMTHLEGITFDERVSESTLSRAKALRREKVKKNKEATERKMNFSEYTLLSVGDSFAFGQGTIEHYHVKQGLEADPDRCNKTRMEN